MFGRKLNMSPNLPPLNLEEIGSIIKAARENYDDEKVNWDSMCCASDSHTDGYNMAFDLIRELCGAKIEWYNEDE